MDHLESPETPMNSNEPSKAAFSIPSILAVVAAIFSFKVGAFFGFVLAGIAILMGIVGILLALSPGKRGGIFSVIGVLGGAVGIVAAVVKAILWLVHAG
jgi:hypothetical protein